MITTEALGTLAGAETKVVINNTLIATTSSVQVSVQRGGDSIGLYLVREVRIPANGSVEIRIKNDGGSALTGSIKVHFSVYN